MNNNYEEIPVYYKRPEENSMLNQSTATSQSATTRRVARMQKPRVERVSVYGLITIIFSIISAICLYKNPRGITFPLFAIALSAYLYLCLKKMEASFRSADFLYFAAIVMFGISVFLTEDKQMTGLAKLMMCLLAIITCLQSLYDESEWQMVKYLHAIMDFIAGFFENLNSPFNEFNIFMQNLKKQQLDEEGNPLPKEKSNAIYIFIGIVVSVPLVAFILYLLCEADAVFKEAVEEVLDVINIRDVIGVVFTVLVIYVISYAAVRFLEMKSIKISDKDTRVNEPVLAITVTSIISVIYLLFSGVQIVYLFLGQLQLPAGYTYAEYAREGFYELLTVCVINLVIVLVCIHSFREHNILKAILTVICICTYIMIASSAFRLYMYVSTYDLTRMRIYAIVALFTLSVLMVGVMMYIYNDLFELFKYGFGVITIVSLILVYSHPTAIVATYNISQMEKSQDYVLDIYYLTDELTTDAIPVIMNHYAELKSYSMDRYSKDYLSDMKYEYFETYECENDYDSPMYNMSMRSFNLSKYLAKRSYDVNTVI